MTAPALRPAASRSGPGHHLARAALLIAGITVAARLVGFLRVVVFARTVGPTCLGDTYYTANTIPNILFDIVAGGALTGLVVPVLAGAVDRDDILSARAVTSALFGWVLVVLVPLTLVAVVLAHPLMSVLVGSGHAPCDRAAEVAVGTRMLRVFAPQILLYGVGVVATGALQAQRRFAGPALAPLLSSLVVIGAYLAYGAISSPAASGLAGLSDDQELILSVGTTVGVAVLALPLLVPLARTAARPGLALRFPPGVGRRVLRLAAAGAVVLGAQQAATAVVLRLANADGRGGAVVLYTLAWTVFLVPWAVVAVPIATSAFPELTARFDAGDSDGYAATAARTTRAMVLSVAAVAAVLAAVALPLARILILGTRAQPDPVELGRAIVAFAPGLLGFGLLAHLSRALYARGDARGPAQAALTGWAVVVAADIALVAALPVSWTVAALGIGNSLGMSVAGALLIRRVAQRAGVAALAGVSRATAAALGAGVAAAVCGLVVADRWHRPGIAISVAVAVVAAAVALAVFAVVGWAVDRSSMRAVVGWSRRG